MRSGRFAPQRTFEFKTPAVRTVSPDRMSDKNDTPIREADAFVSFGKGCVKSPAARAVSHELSQIKTRPLSHAGWNLWSKRVQTQGSDTLGANLRDKKKKVLFVNTYRSQRNREFPQSEGGEAGERLDQSEGFVQRGQKHMLVTSWVALNLSSSMAVFEKLFATAASSPNI